MNSQRHMQLLRVHLLAMARLSQRALDYSIKGYSLRHPDFVRHVHGTEQEVEGHHHRVKELCRDLMNGGIANSADARFTFVAVSISNAFHAVHSASVGIAQDTARLLESTGIQSCPALENIGHHVNAVMRLCIVSLFEQDAACAQTALRQKEAAQFRDLNSVTSHPHIGRWAGAQGDFERSVIRSLAEVAKHEHEMADAILFWLEGDSCTAACVTNGHIAHDLPTSRQRRLSYLPSERMPAEKFSQGFSC